MAKKPAAVERLLQEIPRDALATWLLETAKALPEFGKRLNLYVALHSPPEFALAQYRATIATLLKSRNRNPRKRAVETAQRFAGLIACLNAEFAAGRLDIVMAVCTSGLVLVSHFLRENADPQEKLVAVISELEKLYGMAVTELRPNPAELAFELVAIGQEGSLNRIFRDAAYDYRDVLGESGLASYREALEPYWRDVENGARMRWTQREQTVGQMLAWARAQEDPVGRAAETGRILAATAVTADGFLQAAKSLLRARQEGAALAAAEQGFALALRSPLEDDTLFDLAILRMERATPVAAAEIAWQVFFTRLNDESYRLLRQAAAAAGAELAYWERAKQAVRDAGYSWTPPTPVAK